MSSPFACMNFKQKANAIDDGGTQMRLRVFNWRPSRKGRFWFLARPERVLNRRLSSAISRIEKEREHSQETTDATYGWTCR